MTATERAAHALIHRQLQGRVLPDDVLAAIERVVTEQLHEGLTSEMEHTLRQLIDAYAAREMPLEPPVLPAEADDHAPTVTDVHWTSGN